MEVAQREPNVTAVLARFLAPQPQDRLIVVPRKQPSLDVEVVADGGLRWIKVKASNARETQRSCLGMSRTSRRTVLDTARSLMAIRDQHQIHFRSPRVVFHFSHGVTTDVAQQLQDLGCEVSGTVLPSFFPEITDPDLQSGASSDEQAHEVQEEVGECGDDSESLAVPLESNSVNLDTTALITMVSDICHGGSKEFPNDQRFLMEQAADEEVAPAMAQIRAHAQDKELLVCETALAAFKSIVELLGGEREQQRASELLDRVTVIPDCPSKRVQALRGRKSERNKAVFGTGDHLRVPTVSSNAGFVRSAESQRVRLSVLLHPARALTELKAS